MPKRKVHFTTIYISERMQECLRTISSCAFTMVVAPMGYGKTTAVNWFLDGRAKEKGAVNIRVNIYSDNLLIFWKSVQRAFAFAGLDFLNTYTCPVDVSGAVLLIDELCYTLAGTTEYNVFLDDFHLLTDERIAVFLCTLANRLPENVHLIVASRDRFLPSSEIMRLGRKVYRIGAEHLRLNYTEISAYAHKCGIDLSDTQIQNLSYTSEGWFSAIYLHLCSLAEYGGLSDYNSDIYSMFTAAMIAPLPASKQEFLAVMGLADEFSADMARFITQASEVEAILEELTEQNAFVTRLSDGVSFRFHHMMRECAGKVFERLENHKRKMYWKRYGQWYEMQRQYLHALYAYEKSGAPEASLEVIEKDAGVLLAGLEPQELLTMLEGWPVEALQKHPLALLVLMRRMFTWRQVPKMLELKAHLVEAVRSSLELSEAERGNLMGECDLIMSFLMYNDIIQMSQLHRSASQQMSRPAVTLRNDGSWTFGSPSVLMMFYREPGELARELEAMKDCMPHYYKLTNGHGQGAELVMEAEAAFVKGNFEDAEIELARARERIAACGQENMGLCCDFLALRLSLSVSTDWEYPFEQKRQQLVKQHDQVLLNLFESIAAYYYALLGIVEKIPAVFRDHQLSNVNYLVPGKPMMELIENQVYLAQGAYVRVIARSEELLRRCDGFHYALVRLHMQLQTAAAYERLGKRAEAKQWLEKSLQEAEPDAFCLPFAENYRYIGALLEAGAWKEQEDLVRKIIPVGQKYEENCQRLRNKRMRPRGTSDLTDKELALAVMASQRMTNKEIAAKLFLSEGTVKQYIHQIYSKLQITGDPRTKRQLLAELLQNREKM